jgi:DNA-binding transcriptional MerR regulator
MATTLPAIPAKRYFTIGEVGELCDVKPHVLRYWEQEFTQLRPMKRRGNRRYYQHHEVLMIRRIRDLLYEDGFTISGARNKLQDWVQAERGHGRTQASLTAAENAEPNIGSRIGGDDTPPELEGWFDQSPDSGDASLNSASGPGDFTQGMPTEIRSGLSSLRRELFEIRALLESAG